MCAEVLVGLQEHFLGNVLGLPIVPNEAGGSRKNHILVGTHEACKGVEADGIRRLPGHLNVVFKPRTPSGAESYTLRP